PHYGARPLKRYIETKILNVLAERMVRRSIKPGDSVTVDVKGGGLVIESSTRKKSPLRAPEAAGV
ncbi:MAG: hypothetical protein AAB904_00735, partial [Patescibacteria group bacterium]